MSYVDGFLVPVPKKNLAAYRRMARLGAKIWKKYGALEYRECIGDDLNVTDTASYKRIMKLKPGETVFFSFIVYKSRAHRDRVNAKVLKDPSMAMMDPKATPFDLRRMAQGGFKVWVEA